ncbi:MAG: radical SAM protein [Rhodocyclales bacterium]|nr:radical SAM protein [Rhodocyclales bacterium]
MKTLLLFPPGWSPHSPYLALPLLTARLKAAGHPVDQFDGNIAFIDRLLSADYLRRMLQRLREREGEGEHRELMLLAPHLIDAIDAAKCGFRSHECFSDPQRYEWCRRIVGASLRLVEAAHAGLSLSLHKLAHATLPADSSRNVLAAVHDWEDNPVREFFAACIAPILARDYGLVGMSVADREQLVPALTIAAGIRRLAPATRIVLGGNYLTRIARRWRAPHPFHDLIDFAVLGEGEESIVALVEALSGKGALAGVPNLQYVADGALIDTPARTVSILQAPPPDFDDLPLDLYLSPSLVLPTYTGRSCPWNRCTFCTIASTSGEFRTRPADEIADEMAYLRERYGTDMFTLVDESLPAGVVRRLARSIEARRLAVHWYGETRLVPGFTEELVAEAAKAGLRLLQFGLESYNQRILDRIRKGVREEEVRPLLERCLRHGIGFHLFCMIGFPGETAEEALRTLAFSDEVLAAARGEYGISWCTKGVGTFGLEHGSAVHADPASYGVRLLPTADDKDLAFDCAYDVEMELALGARDAAQLLDRYVGADVYALIARRRRDGFPNRSLAPAAPREEEAFVAAVAARDPQALGLRKHAVGVFPGDWLAHRGAGMPPWAQLVVAEDSSVLVDALGCRVVRLPPQLAATAQRAERGETLAAAERAMLSLALDWLVPDAGGAEGEAVVANEAAELMFLGESDAVLYDPLRERAMRLNLSGALLWLLIQPANLSVAEIADKAGRMLGEEMSAERLAAFLGRLAQHGMLARVSATAGHA